MTVALRRLLVVLAVAGAGFLPAPAMAAGYCTSGSGVNVVVDFGALGGGIQKGCDASGNRTAAKAFIDAGHSLTYASHQPGFVCRVDGVPTSDPCVNASPADAYWGLYWSDGTSGWTYSSMGADSLTVPAGATVAFSWQNGGGDPPGTAPAAPAPAATTAPTKQATAKPTTRATVKASPKPAAPGTRATASTAPTSAPTPAAAATTPSSTASASATVSPSASATPTATPTADATTSGPAAVSGPRSADIAPAARSADGGGLPWFLPAAVLVLLAGGAGGATWWRRRRSTS